jgi:hypothetical protein
MVQADTPAHSRLTKEQAREIVSRIDVLTVADVEDVLREAHPGEYIIYRTEEPIDSPNTFEPVCISYLGDDLEPGHNVVYYNISAPGKWSVFIGWVTIHPEPWTQSDPLELMESNMLYPDMEAMCEVIPVLTDRIDPATAQILAPGGGGGVEQIGWGDKGSMAGSSRRGGTEVGEGELAQREEEERRVDVHVEQVAAPSKWLGAEEDKGLFGLLSWEAYVLSTAVCATASRYGGELPCLVRAEG